MSAESSASGFDPEAWCARVPGLERRGAGDWCAAKAAEVSYPEGGHRTLAEIEAASYWFNHRNDVIAAVIARHPPGGALFDVGGGNGYVSAALARRGMEAVVVEPGPEGAATARERGLPVIEAAFQDLDIPQGSIPACGLFDVLEHIENEVDALRRLESVIRPGGMLYVAVPAFSWLWSNEDVHAGHFRRYSRSRLNAVVAEAGFEPLFSTYFFRALVGPLFALRTVPSALGLARRQSAREVASDHTLPAGPTGRVLQASFDGELKTVTQGGVVRFGTSVVIAARKPDRARSQRSERRPREPRPGTPMHSAQ